MNKMAIVATYTDCDNNKFYLINDGEPQTRMGEDYMYCNTLLPLHDNNFTTVGGLFSSDMMDLEQLEEGTVLHDCSGIYYTLTDKGWKTI